MSEKIYTDAEIKQFDRITQKLHSLNQVTRINGRFEIKAFVEAHGKEKCDAMFEVLKRRDRRQA